MSKKEKALVGAPITSPSGLKRVDTKVKIDPLLKQQAKKAGLNFSALLEAAISEELRKAN